MTYLHALEDHKIETERIMAKISETTEDWLAEAISDTFGYCIHNAEHQSAVAQFELSVSVSLPPSLRSLYLNHGGFEIFDADKHLAIWVPTVAALLEKRSSKTFGPEWPSLYTALITYGSRREFDGNLTPGQIAALKRYFVFGTVNHRYEDKTFLIFSSDGHLGTVRYEHDFGSAEWDAQFLPLCEGEMASLSIDAILEPHLRACTDNLRRRLADNNW